MALKTKVKRENVVSEEDGVVEWITDSGKMMKTPAIGVQIVEAASSPEQVIEQAGEAGEADVTRTEPTPKPKKERTPPKAKQAAPAKPAKVVAPPPVAADPVETPKPTKAAAPSKPVKEKIVAKAAKKKSTAKGVRTIGGKEVDLSKYSKVKAPGGGVSFNNGDSTAKKLEGKTLDEVYKIVAKDTKQEEKDLRAKYKHLNPGMQRMSLGNMHRKGPRDAKKEKKSA
jgi:outer membrane biosynthesis protein TonB